jgi:hypothetical protein
MNSLSKRHNTSEQSYPLTLRQARERVLQDLGLLHFSEEQVVQEERQSSAFLSSQTFFAEVLRVVLWALSHEGMNPVYTTRLLHRAYHMIALDPRLIESASAFGESTSPLDGVTWEDGLPQKLRHTLDELELLGDVASLAHGYWLPTPLHFVPLPAIRRWILVGGSPLYRFPQPIKNVVAYSGTARFLLNDPADFGLQSALCTEREWCRMPHEEVDTWAYRTLFTPALQPVEDLAPSVEFYSPQTHATHAQYFRWVNDRSVLKDDRYLIRSRSKAQILHYVVAEVIRGKIVASSPVSLGEGDIRRLLYGIDALVGCPTQVRVTHTGDSWFFSLRSELPRAEYRLFTALGRLHVSPDGQYYPRLWEISSAHVTQAIKALTRLAIRLEGVDSIPS